LKGAKEKQQQRISAKKPCFCSTQLKIPAELPNVEKTLKIQAAAFCLIGYGEILAKYNELDREKAKFYSFSPIANDFFLKSEKLQLL
jgi:hypothetical protein